MACKLLYEKGYRCYVEPTQEDRSIRDLKNADFVAMALAIEQSGTVQSLQNMDAEEGWECFKDLLLKLEEKHIPINPRPDTVFRHLRSDRGGGFGATPLAFPKRCRA